MLAVFPALPPFWVMCPSPCRVTLHVAWPVSGLGGPFGPFFLYSDYYVLVTVYVILGRDPRRWGLGVFHGAVSSCFLSQDFMGAFNASVIPGHGAMTPRGPRGSLISGRNAQKSWGLGRVDR